MSVQKARVLAALQANPAGICQGDFIDTPAIDGGPRITRIAARIDDLEREGHRIKVAGKRNRYAVYRLVTLGAAPDTGVTATAATPSGPATPPRATIYHVVCDACGHRTQQYEWYALPCDCGAPLHWVGIYTSQLNARRHTPFRRIQVQTRRAA